MSKSRSEFICLLDIMARAYRFSREYYYWKDYFSDNNHEPKMSFESARKVHFSTTCREVGK